MKVSYGSVTLVDGRWVIDTDPHVRSRLKRVFPRVPQQAGGVLSLLATPENTRELEWFIERFPMRVDPARAMARLARQHRETERRVGELLAGHVPLAQFELAKPPREYQRLAAQMLDAVDGLLLADEVGLGKTVSAICPMTQPGYLPALVVCPAHLPGQWQEELAQFAPQLRVHVLRTTQPYDLAAPRRGRGKSAVDGAGGFPDVIIGSYHKVRGWGEALAPHIRYVVFDEAQALRSPDTQIYQAAEYVASRARKRLGLSATPIHNLGNEYWNLLNVLVPGGLGEYAEFLREWCQSDFNGKARLADPREFSGHLRREGLMLRRTRKDVGRELPSLTKVVHTVETNQAPFEELGSAAVDLANIILLNNEQYRGQRMRAAGEFDSLLRQATGIAKAPYVAQFVRMILESGEPVILYGWHRAVYAIWMEALGAYNPVLYTGSESPGQKQRAVDDFKSGKSKVFIMSLRSGAGVDGLQEECSIGVFGELDWSGAVLHQCAGRFHRDGQGDPCTAYYLVSDSGSDPVMLAVLGIKREQLEGVCNPDGALIERIETGDSHIRRLAREFLERRGPGALPPNVIPLRP